MDISENQKRILRMVLGNRYLIEQRTEEYDRIFDGNFAEMFEAMEVVGGVIQQMYDVLRAMRARINILSEPSIDEVLTKALQQKDAELKQKKLENEITATASPGAYV